MDFDINIQVIQNALIKAENLRNYNRLTNRGGNEDDFDNVAKIIQDVLIEAKILKPDGGWDLINEHFMRKITFFIILNSAIEIHKKLVNIDDLEHLIWKAPELPKCLMIHIVWKLNFNDFYCEIIRYSCQDLAIELLNIAKDNMKYTNPQDTIVMARKIICAAYESINRMFGNLQMMIFDIDKLRKFYECILQLMKFYQPAPPNGHKMTGWTPSKLIKHEGQLLLNLIGILFDCFVLFIAGPKDVPQDCEIYRYTFGGTLDLSLSEKKNNIMETINSFLIKLNELFTGIFLQVFQTVTVEKVCHWSEFVVDNSKLSLQSWIAFEAYKLQKLVENEHPFDKQIAQMLSTISQKPKTLFDIIKEADAKTTFETAMKQCEEQKFWIIALIKLSNFFDEMDYVVFISNNINLVEPQGLDVLFVNGYHRLKLTNHERATHLKELLVKTFHQMPDELKKKHLLGIIDCSVQCNNLFELPDFQTSLTSYLNKVVNIQENSSETYTLFLQNPVVFYEKCLETGVSNIQQAVAVMNILRKLKLCEKPLIHLRDKLGMFHQDGSLCGFAKLSFNGIQHLKPSSISTEAEKQGFLYILENMIAKNILDPHILISEINVKLGAVLNAKNFELTLVYLEALDVVFVPDYLLKTMLLLGVIMETARWDLWSYTASSTLLVNHTIKLTKKYLTMYLELCRPLNTEVSPLCNKLQFLTPLNRFYFNVLWGHPFDTQQYAPCGDFNTDVLHVSMILNKLTSGEVKLLSSSLLLCYTASQCANMLCQAVISSGSIVDHMESNACEATSCLLYTCRNIAAVLLDIIAKDSSIQTVIDIYIHISRLINSRSPRRREETMDCFLIIMSRVFSIMKEHPTSLDKLFIMHPVEGLTYQELMDKFKPAE